MPRGDLIVHVDRRDTRISAECGVLHLRDAGHHQTVPIAELGLVVINGSAQTTVHALRALTEAGVPLLAIGGRQRLAPAWVGNGLATTVRVRHAQHLAYANSATRLVAARQIVRAKFASQCAVASRHWQSSALTASLQSLEARLDYCDRVDALRGIEGAAGAAWFSRFGECLPARWNFVRRERRPPPCPTNALLSYLYAVVGSEVQEAVTASGLDPSLGFLHEMYPGRSALTLDVLEVLRPGVDAIVLALLQQDTLQPGDFSTGKEGCRIGKPARIALMQAYAEARLEWPSTDAPMHTLLRQHLQDLRRTLIPNDNCGDECDDPDTL